MTPEERAAFREKLQRTRSSPSLNSTTSTNHPQTPVDTAAAAVKDEAATTNVADAAGTKDAAATANGADAAAVKDDAATTNVADAADTKDDAATTTNVADAADNEKERVMEVEESAAV